jgi:hypothetical protein
MKKIDGSRDEKEFYIPRDPEPKHSDFGSKVTDQGVGVLKVLCNGLPAMHSTSCGTEAEMLGSLMMLPSGVYSTHTVQDHHSLKGTVPRDFLLLVFFMNQF